MLSLFTKQYIYPKNCLRMKKRLLLLLPLLMCGLMLQAKSALVVIAHGSPMMSWRKPVLALEHKVDSLVKAKGLSNISYVRVAMMEYTEPSVASVIKDCEKQGVDTVFALPLFIAPSSHSEEDLPNLLGLKFTPDVREELAEENAELVKSPLRIILGPTLYSTDILEKVMLNNVKQMSKNPKEEALLLVAHGDPERIGFWQILLYRTCEYVKKHTGITYADGELIEMGTGMEKEMLPLIEKAAKEKERVLVQGIYLTSTIAGMARRNQMEAKQAGIVKKYGTQVVYSENGILPNASNAIDNWIVERTEEFLKH